ncbi:hypothetical protein TRFO_09771 [Tritrichomonas foetus]|uniref:Uncharacterized protein n=1 Tax=Tritrichomonas foetus TaxID=1144522 RepID=A0A1J4JEY6_9EUKA|nr:hypothetical protein TRFO_09771 [Tritrichomonas foetus]|eukprot:OHS96863.1 hypothetical protein TRFO_09771 [Tritrichomonas foetus]
MTNVHEIANNNGNRRSQQAILISNEMSNSKSNQETSSFGIHLSEIHQEIEISNQKEREILQNILNLEVQQQKFFEERLSYLMKLRKTQNPSGTNKKILQLQEEVEQLSKTYTQSFNKNQKLFEKFDQTTFSIKDTIENANNGVKNAENRLNEEIKNQNIREKDILRLSQQILQMENQIELLEAEKINCNEKKEEAEIESVKINNEISSQRKKMNDLHSILEEAKQNYEILLEEKENRRKSQKRKAQYDESQLSELTENINQIKVEQKQYEKKINHLKNEEIPELMRKIEKATKELNHLLEAHDVRRKQRNLVSRKVPKI